MGRTSSDGAVWRWSLAVGITAPALAVGLGIGPALFSAAERAPAARSDAGSAPWIARSRAPRADRGV